MSRLIKPHHLSPGDKIAAVSTSAGLAGSIPYRYEVGKRQLQEEFGVKIVEMQHTLKDLNWVKLNPRARADDLVEAFADPSVKGIISTIGGEDSIRILPYIDIEVIRANPKVFIGYSDSTVSHFLCNRAGITSFYGPSILANFAENRGMFPYMVDYLRKAVFSTEPIGEVLRADQWTVEYLDWFKPENQEISRAMRPALGRRLLQGTGKARGQLIGGCIQVFNMILGTEIWPDAKAWENAIVFMEVSEGELPINFFQYTLRNMGAQGIWNTANGVVFARPGGQRSDQEFTAYEQALKDSIGSEYGRPDMPILSQLDFGHTDPVFTIPYGVQAEIDAPNKKFSILESGVQ